MMLQYYVTCFFAEMACRVMLPSVLLSIHPSVRRSVRQLAGMAQIEPTGPRDPISDLWTPQVTTTRHTKN